MVDMELAVQGTGHGPKLLEFKEHLDSLSDIGFEFYVSSVEPGDGLNNLCVSLEFRLFYDSIVSITSNLFQFWDNVEKAENKQKCKKVFCTVHFYQQKMGICIKQKSIIFILVLCITSTDTSVAFLFF